MARKARSMMAKCSRATAGDLARRLRTARSGYPPRESVTRSTSTRDGPLPCAHVSATHTPSEASPISRTTDAHDSVPIPNRRSTGGGVGGGGVRLATYADSVLATNDVSSISCSPSSILYLIVVRRVDPWRLCGCVERRTEAVGENEKKRTSRREHVGGTACGTEHGWWKRNYVGGAFTV